ncbi:hypothetical protein [Stratiformator vulcanicus]|uniref:Uncharacterized protein n=1 Tax=Stratiformator vulcanicus TaxID=2527980 RepID=A0A517QXK5_9PLAN|nr:hypothetical protein [Stratiformator vulcanicus]QDT36327.1 hypothetical protein Pan189_06830 [Stratiformator vulcanicus]
MPEHTESDSLIARELVVGQKLRRIICKSGSDDRINFCDVIIELNNSIAFRLPTPDYMREGRIECPAVEVPSDYQTSDSWFTGPYRWRFDIWSSPIADLLLPSDPEERFLDSGCLALASGIHLMVGFWAPLACTTSGPVFNPEQPEETMRSIWMLDKDSPDAIGPSRATTSRL